jgi:choline kinase
MSEVNGSNPNYYVAIMAGGIGSRFWPQSRTGYPKQFLDILNTGKSLIQWTFERFAAFVPKENIYVVTAEEYSSICAEQLPDIPQENIIAEPSRKNTAPCVAYISYKLSQLNPDANLICAPADHLILEPEKFINEMLRVLKKNGIISIALPCDPGILWRLGRFMMKKTYLKKRMKKEYDHDYIIATEHINSIFNLYTIIRKKFKVIEEKFYPFNINIIDINLFYICHIKK